MSNELKANYDSVVIQFEGMMEDLHEASPTAALNTMRYAVSMAIQFTMGSRVDDFIFKSHGEEVRTKKVEDMANVIGYMMRWMPVQAIELCIADSFEYMESKGLKEQIIPEDRIELLVATGMSEEEVRLGILGNAAKEKNLFNKQKATLEERRAEVKAAGSRVVLAAMQNPNPTLKGCEGWVINQMIAKMDMALFGNGKTFLGHVGYLFTGILKGTTAYAPELADINNHDFKSRIERIYAEYETTKEQWMFEVSRAMEQERTIGDDEAPDFAG